MTKRKSEDLNSTLRSVETPSRTIYFLLSHKNFEHVHHMSDLFHRSEGSGRGSYTEIYTRLNKITIKVDLFNIRKFITMFLVWTLEKPRSQKQKKRILHTSRKLQETLWISDLLLKVYSDDYPDTKDPYSQRR